MQSKFVASQAELSFAVAKRWCTCSAADSICACSMIEPKDLTTFWHKLAASLSSSMPASLLACSTSVSLIATQSGTVKLMSACSRREILHARKAQDVSKLLRLDA